MVELTCKQLDFIRRDIRKRGIKSNHLVDDVVDHICCSVENEMAKGQSFRDAYLITIRLFGPHGLKHVEIDTRLIVSKSYILTRCMNIVINLISLLVCLFFVVFPFFISIDEKSYMYILLFSPVILTGLWAIIFGFSYRKFEYKLHIEKI